MKTKCKQRKVRRDMRYQTDPEYRQRHNTLSNNRVNKLLQTNASYKERFKANVRNKALQYKYGITTEIYDRILLKQNKRCKICGSCSPGKKYKHFQVDHDHKTGKVRGLLCHTCNKGLGCFKEDMNVLLKAVKYMKR